MLQIEVLFNIITLITFTVHEHLMSIYIFNNNDFLSEI